MARSCRNWTLSDGNVAFEVRPVALSICRRRTFLSALVRAHPPRVVFTSSAWPRSLALGRRTARTLPLLPPPQKNRSPPSDSSPDTPVPGGISSLSRTSPVRGSMRLTSLSSPSQVPCQSSPSTQVTPVTKRLDFDGAQDRACLGIDLVDLAAAMLPDPERAFGPGQPRVAAVAGRRDRRKHAAGLRIDLLDAILGDLKQVLAVEGRSCMRGDIDRAHRLSALGIEGVQPVSGRKPDVLAVKRDAMHAVDPGKGPYSRRISAADRFMPSTPSRSAAGRGVTRLS